MAWGRQHFLFAQWWLRLEKEWHRRSVINHYFLCVALCFECQSQHLHMRQSSMAWALNPQPVAFLHATGSPLENEEFVTYSSTYKTRFQHKGNHCLIIVNMLGPGRLTSHIVKHPCSFKSLMLRWDIHLSLHMTSDSNKTLFFFKCQN